MAWEYNQQAFRIDERVFDRWADRYDDLIPRSEEAKATVDTLAELCPGKRILELAVGTGRIAIPLANRGFLVSGLDSSPRMLERLREQEASGEVEPLLADMRNFDLDRQFDLIALLLNGLYLLPDQQAQVDCLRASAKHLAPGGRLVIEGFVPPSRDAFRFGQATTTTFLSTDPPEVRLECSLHDPLQQVVRSQVVSITESGPQFFPVQMRYVYPSELDLMAQLAGLRLVARYGGWQRVPLNPSHTNCVSVYERSENV